MAFIAKPFVRDKELFPNYRRFGGKMLSTLNKIGKEMADKLREIPSTWDHKPTFSFKVGYWGGDATVYAFTNDKVFNILNRGTWIRYATMTADFEPKTSYRNFASGPGKGSVAFISRHWPQPGITGREWYEALQEEFLPILSERVDNMITEMLIKG